MPSTPHRWRGFRGGIFPRSGRPRRPPPGALRVNRAARESLRKALRALWVQALVADVRNHPNLPPVDPGPVVIGPDVIGHNDPAAPGSPRRSRARRASNPSPAATRGFVKFNVVDKLSTPYTNSREKSTGDDRGDVTPVTDAGRVDPARAGGQGRRPFEHPRQAGTGRAQDSQAGGAADPAAHGGAPTAQTTKRTRKGRG